MNMRWRYDLPRHRLVALVTRGAQTVLLQASTLPELRSTFQQHLSLGFVQTPIRAAA